VVGEEAMVGAPEAAREEVAQAPAPAAAAMEVEVTGREAAKGEAVEEAAAGAIPPRSVAKSPLGEAGS